MRFILKDRLKQLSQLENKLGYHFKNPMLLNKALTHKSYAYEKKNRDVKDNERLEFLGDAVIDLIVSDYSVRKYLTYMEGELTKIRAAVVNETSLATISRKIGLGEFLLLGKGETNTGGRDKNSILANSFEAVIAAIYLDGSLEHAYRIIINLFKKKISHLSQYGIDKEYKSKLQELVQNKMSTVPTYKVANEFGPDHDKVFEVNVLVNGIIIGTGMGKSKKEAEQAAAKEAMNTMD